MTRLAAMLALAAMCLGCAKFPTVASSDFTKRLVFTMTVDTQLRTGLEEGGSGLPYVYIIALRLSTDANPIDDGPLPVVVPGGNGFVAGNATHYILWNPLASPSYQIWQFQDATLDSLAYYATRCSCSVASVSTSTRRISRRRVGSEKLSDQLRDRLAVFLEGEVTGVQQVELEVFEVVFVGVGALGWENRVVLAPDHKGRGLVDTEVLLPRRVQRRVATVVVEQGELNLLIAGSVEQWLDVPPIVRANGFKVADAVGVLPLRRVQGQ